MEIRTIVVSIAVVLSLSIFGCDETPTSDNGDDSEQVVFGHHQFDAGSLFSVDGSNAASDSFEKALVEEIAARNGYTVSFQSINTSGGEFFPTLAAALDDGTIDVLIGGLEIRPGRGEQVDFVTPHLPEGSGDTINPFAFSVRQGNANLKAELDEAIEALQADGTLDSLITAYNVLEPGPIRWAVLDPYNGGDTTFNSSLQTAETFLESELDREVDTVTYTQYSDVVDDLAGWPGEVDMAIMPTFTYLVANADGDAESAGIGQRFGSTTYKSQIVAKSGSGISSLAGISGKAFLRPDPLSTSGWVIPEIMLSSAGVDTDNDITIVEGDGHVSVIQGVYNETYGGNSVDAGATYVDARNDVDSESYPDVNSTVDVVATSEEIPNDGLAFHPNVALSIRESVVDALQAMAASATTANSDAFTTATSWETVVDADDSFYDDFRTFLTDNGADPTGPF